MAKRRRLEWGRFALVAAGMSLLLEDHACDILLCTQIKRRSPEQWMGPYLVGRTDPTERNTLAKLETDFLRLGCTKEFTKTTRMTVGLHLELLEKVRPLILRKDTNFRKAITPEERLSLTIRYLTRGDSVFTLHQSYLVGECTVLPIVRDTCRAIFNVLHEEHLKTPRTRDEWEAVADGFHDRWNFPHTLGAVDGKHIRLKCPQKSGSEYFNYKHYFSIILLAIADSDYRFLYVDVGAEGKASDSTLFAQSQFAKDIEDPTNPLDIPPPSEFPGHQGSMNFFFIGDDAFSLGPHMMKPFPSTTLTMSQRIFNYRISRARRVVENTFGVLSTRFRVLRGEIQMEPDGARDVVMACIVLHNFLKDRMPKTYVTRPSTDWEGKDYRVHRGLWRKEVDIPGSDKRLSKRNHSLFVKTLRERLQYWCLTKEGECPWQYDIVLRSLFYD